MGWREDDERDLGGVMPRMASSLESGGRLLVLDFDNDDGEECILGSVFIFNSILCVLAFLLLLVLACLDSRSCFLCTDGLSGFAKLRDGTTSSTWND